MLGFIDCSVMMKPAVYALISKGKIVYIGQSKKPIVRVASHLNGGAVKLVRTPFGNRMGKMQFDEIKIRLCKVSELDNLERELIRQYKPKYNIRYNPDDTIEQAKIFLQRYIAETPKSHTTFPRRL